MGAAVVDPIVVALAVALSTGRSVEAVLDVRVPGRAPAPVTIDRSVTAPRPAGRKAPRPTNRKG